MITLMTKISSFAIIVQSQYIVCKSTRSESSDEAKKRSRHLSESEGGAGRVQVRLEPLYYGTTTIHGYI